MKKLKKLEKLMTEVKKLIINFFKPHGISDEILALPKNIKRLGFRAKSIQLLMTVLTLAFSFLLKCTNTAIEYKLIGLGIAIFMLYQGKEIVRAFMMNMVRSESTKFERAMEDEIVLRCSKIIGKVSEKVMKYDLKRKFYQVIDNESVLNCVKEYLTQLWSLKLDYIFNICEMLCIVGMLITAIVTNSAISQKIFIPMILTFALVSFISFAYISISRNIFCEDKRKVRDEQSLIINDILRIPIIVSRDVDMRINKYQKIIERNHMNAKSFYKKLNLSMVFNAIFETIANYGIIVVYLLGVEWNNISVETIANMMATLMIAQTALTQVQRLAVQMDNHNERVCILEKEEGDMLNILKVYYSESEKNLKKQEHRIESIRLTPFSIQYTENSENDKAFRLVSENAISIESGEISVLYGPSGSGKSTFMKMLTERIRLSKNTEIPSTSRYIFYDERMKLGSFSIYEELFCGCENPDLSKMQEIMENLHLWNEIGSNCIDVWQWMRQKKFEQSLSNGQKQRLVLAKILYWLDDGIDVLVLDECTSGLDDKAGNDSADAERVLEYIIRYANTDKKRIVIISTHQNIDDMKEKLGSEYTFRNFQFKRKEDYNLIEEA